MNVLRVRCLMLLAVAAIVGRPSESFADDAMAAPSTVERGKYLATVGNCISCHTVSGGTPFAGGVPFHTKFGTVYSTNITPDRDTGIGAWTQAQFYRAMREGIRADGEHLYPAFPYPAFTKLSDSDLDAIFAYLKTVATVRAPAPLNDLSFPFNQRPMLAVWKALYFDENRFQKDPKRSSEWNRGAYLVEALAHCGACHSPRNFLGAERNDLALTGGTYLDKVKGGQIRPWSAVNLTPALSGLKAWSVEDTTRYLVTGVNSYAYAFGPMNKVIMNSTRHLSEADARAIAIYLAGIAPKEQPAGAKADRQALSAGEGLYSIHCGTCHLPTGQGSMDTGTALAGNPVVQAPDPASLINVILHGPELPDPLPPAKWTHMDAYGEKLTDREVADLVSYLRSAWGHRGDAATEDHVAAQR